MCEVCEKKNILETNNLEYLCTGRREARSKSGGFPVLQDEQPPVDLSWNISQNLSLYLPRTRLALTNSEPDATDLGGSWN